jgi:hypothetical protein
MAASHPSEKQARKFFETINSLDFDIVMFLFELDKQSFQMKERVLTILEMMIDDFALRYDAQLHKNEDELFLYAKAKRIQEAMQPYRMQD